MEVLKFLQAVYHFMGSMQYVFAEYFLVSFILLFVSLASKFFTELARMHAAYYASIGSPSFRSTSVASYLHATKCMFKMLVGFPKDFPEDEQLRDQMDRYCAALVLFVLVAALVIFAAGFWQLPVPVAPTEHLQRF